MRPLTKLIAISLLLTTTLHAQLNNYETFASTSSLAVNQNNSESFHSLFNLLVTNLSNPSQPPGGSFMYSIKLMDLSGPVANADVKINDPFERVCTSTKTGPDGNVIWVKSIPINIKPQLYIIEFFYENAKQYSKIAVSSKSIAVELPNYNLDLNISKSLDASSLVIGNSGGFSLLSQNLEAALDEVVKFGDAVAKDFLSSSLNEKIIVLTGITCSVPNPTCAAAITFTTSAFINSGIKVLGYNIIDAAEKDPEKRNLIKKIFDGARTGISFATFKSGEGLKSFLDFLSIDEDVIEFVKKEYININGKLQGASFSAKKKGSDEVYMMCFYDRDTPNQTTPPNQTISPPSKDPNCKENNNGDYCFQNNTKLDLNVTLYSSPSKTRSYNTPFTCTLQPGQQQCFFSVPAGPAKYDINNYGSLNVMKQYNAEGSVYVDQCKTNTFFINLETPSYSSNIPAQTNVNTNQTSKDTNCKDNHTGDYCFQNNSKLDLRVTFFSSPSKFSPYAPVPVLTCTLQPGQRQCFFDVPIGAAKYEINNFGVLNGVKQYNAEGSVYVDQCEENTFFINLETVSYSTNIPAQANANTNQTSKDPDCKEKNTGDYSFQNNTKLDLRVTFFSSPSKFSPYAPVPVLTCTLQPGQRQCFFDVPAGAARYEINNFGILNGVKQYNAEGSLYVDACQEKIFIIK